MLKNFFKFTIILIFTFNYLFALSFDFTKIPFLGYFFEERNTLANPQELVRLSNLKINEEPVKNIYNKKEVATTTILTSTEINENKDLDYEDFLREQNTQKQVQAKMKLLLINTEEKNSISDTCKFANQEEVEACKKDLFIGCADSLYLGFDMAPECQQFSVEDYLNFVEIKTKQEDEKIGPDQFLETKIGEVQIIQNIFSQKNIQKSKEENINSSSINNDLEIVKKEVEIAERKIVDTVKPVQKVVKIFWNTNMPPTYFGWVTGWGTLFATNGGEKESGMEMNQYTAFGYDPYNPSVCIVSLPYKTVDKLFGTQLNYCIKNQNVNCVLRIKKQLRNRAIEVIMIKNGKRAILPLGEFGPAEWTGNAIDFTSCAKKVLGATGKDLVKFRALPY